MSKKKQTTFALALFCLMLIALSAGTQNAKATPIAVRVIPLSETKIVLGEQTQFLAQAQYIGNYSYKWYANQEEIQNTTSIIIQNATGSFLTYIPTQFGIFNITCVVTDLTGTFDPGTSTPVTLTVLTDKPVAQGAPTQGQTSDNSQLPLQAIIIAVILVIAVIGAAIVIVIRQRNSKKIKSP